MFDEHIWLWIVALAAYLITVFWGVEIAKSKGRPAWIGWALGHLFIAGIVLLWLIPADRRALWEREQHWSKTSTL